MCSSAHPLVPVLAWRPPNWWPPEPAPRDPDQFAREWKRHRRSRHSSDLSIQDGAATMLSRTVSSFWPSDHASRVRIQERDRTRFSEEILCAVIQSEASRDSAPRTPVPVFLPAPANRTSSRAVPSLSGCSIRWRERDDSQPSRPCGYGDAAVSPGGLLWQRCPPGDCSGAGARLRVVGDPWEPSAHLDSGRQLSLLIEDGSDRGGISLGNDEHPNSMAVCTTADKRGASERRATSNHPQGCLCAAPRGIQRGSPRPARAQRGEPRG